MKRTVQSTAAETASPEYQALYKIGALAALIAALFFRRNMDAEYYLLRASGLIHSGPASAPGAISAWFELLQHNWLLGLILLNLFDLVNYALVGLIFLALFEALKKASRSGMLIAASFSLVGIASYFASNQAFTLLSLSRQYSAATTGSQQVMLLAAGQAALAIHQNAGYAGSGLYLSFLLVSIAGLIISAVMLRSPLFGKVTAYLGILANGFGLGYYLALALFPALVFLPLSISAVFLLIWYLRISARLWALGLQSASRAMQTAACGERLLPPLEISDVS